MKSTLFICLDGTAYNRPQMSIISNIFNGLEAREISIEPDEKNVLRSRLVIKKSGTAKEVKNCYKLYFPGPGAASEKDHKRPGKYSSVLNVDKRKAASAIERLHKKNHKKRMTRYTQFTRIPLRKKEIDDADLKDLKTRQETKRAIPNEIKSPVIGEDLSLAHHFYGTNFYRIDRPGMRYIGGMALGAGRKENVIKAATIIANKKFEKIVISGWSRGAATAIHIANQLHELGIKTPVYLFLIDPVVGLDDGITDPNTRNLPENVAECVNLLAMGDECQEFHPQDKERMNIETKGKVEFLPVHGTHSQVAGVHDGKNVPEMITEHLLRDFIAEIEGAEKAEKLLPKPTLLQEITQQKTEIKEPESLEKKLIRAYAETQVDFKDYYHKLGPFSIYTKESRPFTPLLHTYTKHATIFVNDHHRKLFKKCYPEIYARIKTRNTDEINPEFIWESKMDIHSKRIIISATFLQDFDIEIARIPNDSIHKLYKQSLLELRQAAQKEICDRLGRNHNKPYPRNLNILPLLSECQKAVKMNKTLISEAAPAKKWKAIQEFSDIHDGSCSKIAKKVAACAAALLVGLILGAALSPLSLYKCKGFQMAKAASYATHDYIFFNNDVARKAAKAARAREENPHLPGKGDPKAGAENRQPSSSR